MEKKSYISSAQIVLILFITRLLFSTTYQSVFNAGNSIQDILLSLPVNFISNFVIAIPLLIMLGRHPGHDPIECATKVAGRGFASIIAIFYFLFFIGIASVSLGNYKNFFTIAVIADVNSYVIGIFIIVVCVYGAIKGIEAIARAGSVVAVIYILTFVTIFFAVIYLINLDYLKPLLYHGTTYLMKSTVMNYNLSYQIVLLAFLAPFMRQGGSPGKSYAVWNIVSIAILFLLEFFVVTVTGSFGAKQLYPLQILSTLTHISVFEQLDVIDMVSWILNTIITVTINMYLAVQVLLKLGLDKHRKLLAMLSGVIVLFAATFISRRFYMLQSVMVSGMVSLIVTAATIVIPLIILIADLIKGRMVQNEQNEQNVQNVQNQQGSQNP